MAQLHSQASLQKIPTHFGNISNAGVSRTTQRLSKAIEINKSLKKEIAQIEQILLEAGSRKWKLCQVETWPLKFQAISYFFAWRSSTSFANLRMNLVSCSNSSLRSSISLPLLLCHWSINWHTLPPNRRWQTSCYAVAWTNAEWRVLEFFGVGVGEGLRCYHAGCSGPWEL